MIKSSIGIILYFKFLTFIHLFCFSFLIKFEGFGKENLSNVYLQVGFYIGCNNISIIDERINFRDLKQNIEKCHLFVIKVNK